MDATYIPPPPEGWDDTPEEPTAKKPQAKTSAASAEAADAELQRQHELEAAVEAVDEGQRLLVDLDRRSNATREGMRAIQKKLRTTADRKTSVPVPRRKLPAGYYGRSSAAAGARPTEQTTSAPLMPRTGWMCAEAASEAAANPMANQWLFTSSGVFVRTRMAAAEAKLSLEVRELTEATEEAREELKNAVCDVARLEGADSALSRLRQGFDLKPQ
jgi:hypothetical protein